MSGHSQAELGICPPQLQLRGWGQMQLRGWGQIGSILVCLCVPRATNRKEVSLRPSTVSVLISTGVLIGNDCGKVPQDALG